MKQTGIKDSLINETFSGKLKNSSKSEKTENAESLKIFFIIKTAMCI